MSERVIVLDFGAQYNQLIVRRIRELGVFAELLPNDTSPSDLKGELPRGIVLSGGPGSVYDDDALGIHPDWLRGDVPVLGICYGMQLMAAELGGQVLPAQQREYGPAVMTVCNDTDIFAGLAGQLNVWMSHGDKITVLPDGFSRLGSSDTAEFAAMGDGKRFGVQFHPEVSHTERGRDILRNFLFDVCGCTGSWTMASFLQQERERIAARVGSERALVALSGGVDSSVAAALVHEAIGEQLTAVFVDHGLLRAGEAQQVVKTFADHFHLNLIHVDAKDRFLGKLEGVVDPEQKRKIIGETFIRVFEDEAEKLPEIRYLVQGTLYPDVIESGTAKATVIKSHHNVGGLPETMRFELLEPLRELFKDEVRTLGRELGLPAEMVGRQPFPGPGLAIRMVGEVNAERLDVLRAADAIVQEEIARAGLSAELWQWFAVLPGVRSVGVMGDKRTYAEAIVIRAVTSSDGMTADWARLPQDLLLRMSTRIVNEIDGVNRVLYDITSKPPGTIEWE